MYFFTLIFDFIFFFSLMIFLMLKDILSGFVNWFSYIFHPRIFFVGILLGGLGLNLLPYSTIDNSKGFLSIIDMIAQLHVGPLSLPLALLGISIFMISLSYIFSRY
ncbi:hypothetical protein XFUD_12395 (plasmid) [Xylella fastidiosa]|nr:hypothetical protein XFUD_12395 [Xylella fastidiosa]OCA56922.1 hypothetical protein AA93_12420 [Xylella fastidiosa subsp. pauca 11399]KXB10303.1 hypothetical protein ADT29_00020 [Xylella fastidiosa]KXB18608.1 hypothetical protein ADT28_00020 [Xylella fastidiosa]NRP55547.1 hypothetical protein [Xylella fastidiosa]